MTSLYKIFVGVPEKDADKIRKVIGEFGGGRYKNYEFASFSVKGTGRFRPLEGAKPAVGRVGKIEAVAEEQIQSVVEKKFLKRLITEIRRAHPYEEPVIEVIKIENV